MSKPLPVAQLETRVLRYLLVEGRPCDFTEIRLGADLGKLTRSKIWTAIRSLIEARWISYAYATERTTYEGFEQTLSYPVFWVNADNLLSERGAARSASQWWAAVIAPLGGEGVRP